MANVQKIKDALFIFLVTGFFCWIANAVSYEVSFAKSSIGAFILVAITFLGYVIAQLPVAKKLPAIFWVSLVAIIASIPSFPLSSVILEYTREVNFLAITTPLLAYAGLSIGKDIEAFKKLSWRIVPVALAVAAGSFICSTLLAEVLLHLEGVF